MTGLLFTLMLVVLLLAAYQILNGGRVARKDPPGLSDLVQWAFVVGDGTVLQKDGSLVRGWRYRGPDVSSATVEELNAFAAHMNTALLPMTDNWMFHIDAVRQVARGYAPDGAFPDAACRVIDVERRAAYEGAGDRYETECFLVATYLPPPDVFSHLAKHFTQGEQADLGWDAILEVFNKDLRDLEDRLSAWLHMDQLGSDDLVTHLHRCLTGETHPVMAPDGGGYLDVLLASKDLLGGTHPKVGEKHLRTIAFMGYPRESWMAMLDVLSQQPFSYRWSTRVIPLGQLTADKLIKRRQLDWFKKRRSAGAMARDLTTKEGAPAKPQDEEMFEDGDARRMAKQSSDAVAENSSGQVRFCTFNPILVVMEDTAESAEHVASRLVKVLGDAGFTSQIERMNALDSFLGALPGDGYHNVRRPLVSSASVMHLSPLTAVWPGSRTNPSPLFPSASPALAFADTAGTTPFRLNLHVGDVGHTLIVGSTGGGKSTLLGFLMAQFRRYPGAQVFAFDKGNSAELLCRAAGGDHYEVEPGSDTVCFQPLAGVHESTERSWALEWLELLLSLQDLKVTPVQRDMLGRALSLLGQMEPQYRTLSTLSTQIQDLSVRQALVPYLGNGPYGMLFDADQDSLRAGTFQVFEMGKVMSRGPQVLLPALDYLFHRIEQRLDGRPTLIMIDEAWEALKHPIFLKKIIEWLRTLRKFNAAVVIATQSLGEVYQLEERDVILESCPSKIFLPNANARNELTARMYREIGLNDTEVSVLADGVGKRDYYLKSPVGSRLFQLKLGPVALAFLSSRRGMSMQETVAHAQQLEGRHGRRWPAEWLQENGLVEAARQVHTYLGESDDPEEIAGAGAAGPGRRDRVLTGAGR